MGKYINDSQMLGALGESFIRSTVLKMGHIFECIRTDAGLDGTIELRDRATGQMLNLLLRVQVKATSSFRSETADGFSFTCDANDLEYWLKGNTPNILIVCNPQKGTAYWKSIREYFDTPDHRLSKTVKFNKTEDVFDDSTAGRLFHLARSADSGLYMEAPNTPEVLTSNLLEVRALPTTIYIAPTECKSLKEVYSKAYAKGACLPPELLLTEKTLISVHDFREDPVWRLVCEYGGSEPFAFCERFDASGVSDRRLVSEFLHKCLRGFGDAIGLRYSYQDRLFFVQYTKHSITPLTRKFKPSGRAAITKRTRGLVTPLGGKAKGYKHCAFKSEFEMIEGRWYMQISPTYFYTYDGRRKKYNADEFLSRMKRLERNKAVFSQLRLWEEFLCDSGGKDLVSPGYSHIAFGPLAFFNIGRSVPDSLWRKEGDDEDIDEEEGFLI
jgi:hypothetical protein